MSDPTNAAARRCTLCGNFHCPGTPQPDPAPSGLTAAQEIGLAITLKAMELAEKSTHPDVEADDKDIANFVRIVTGVVVPIAVMVEHGPDETPQIREWAQRCPDPAIHDEEVLQAERDEMAALIAERDALAAQVINAPAQVILLEQRQGAVRDAVLAYTDNLLGQTHREQLRAIYSERGDEGRGDG